MIGKRRGAPPSMVNRFMNLHLTWRGELREPGMNYSFFWRLKESVCHGLALNSPFSMP